MKLFKTKREKLFINQEVQMARSTNEIAKLSLRLHKVNFNKMETKWKQKGKAKYFGYYIDTKKTISGYHLRHAICGMFYFVWDAQYLLVKPRVEFRRCGGAH